MLEASSTLLCSTSIELVTLRLLVLPFNFDKRDIIELLGVLEEHVECPRIDPNVPNDIEDAQDISPILLKSSVQYPIDTSASSELTATVVILVI